MGRNERMEMKTLIAQIVDEAVRTAYPGVDAGINYEALLELSLIHI